MRRILLIVLVVVVVIAGVVVALKVRGGASGATADKVTSTPTTAASGTTVAVAGTTATAKATAGPKATPVPVTPQLRAYAVALRPVLKRTIRVFDRVNRQASTSNLPNLSTVCFNSLKPLGIAQAQAEGVAHPYPWWTQVGRLHHTLMGIYHVMVGAADECSTAAGNGQASDASAAVTIMKQQNGAMHAMQARVIRLSQGQR
jgi:hypothetical protein